MNDMLLYECISWHGNSLIFMLLWITPKVLKNPRDGLQNLPLGSTTRIFLPNYQLVFFLSSTISSRVCDPIFHFKLKKKGVDGMALPLVTFLWYFFLLRRHCTIVLQVFRFEKDQNNFPQLLKDLHSTRLEKIN